MLPPPPIPNSCASSGCNCYDRRPRRRSNDHHAAFSTPDAAISGNRHGRCSAPLRIALRRATAYVRYATYRSPMDASTLAKSAKALILASGLIAASTVIGAAQDAPMPLGTTATIPLNSWYIAPPSGQTLLGAH